MDFQLPNYRPPEFSLESLCSAPNARVALVAEDGVAPEGYHALSIFPEYFKLNGKWELVNESRMDCVPVVKPDGRVEAVEFRHLKEGDSVVVGRSENGMDGILVYSNGFRPQAANGELFAFRTGRSRETAYTRDYDRLYDLLRHEREDGYIVWVLGPAVVFDHDSRSAVAALIESGYAHAILAGNAMATHDLEAGMFGTALGQEIYTQEARPNGHYNHLDLINRARKAGSLEELIRQEQIASGVVSSTVRNQVPLVLAGSIRDDGPLPQVMGDTYAAQDEMRKHLRKATTVICLATMLHTIAAGNMTPSYTIRNGKVRPVFIYYVDIAEFAVNKLRDRGSLEVTTIVTNVQDFLVNLRNNLI